MSTERSLSNSIMGMWSRGTCLSSEVINNCRQRNNSVLGPAPRHGVRVHCFLRCVCEKTILNASLRLFQNFAFFGASVSGHINKACVALFDASINDIKTYWYNTDSSVHSTLIYNFLAIKCLLRIPTFFFTWCYDFQSNN